MIIVKSLVSLVQPGFTRFARLLTRLLVQGHRPFPPRANRKDHTRSWGPEQFEAFSNLRDLISSDTVLAQVDPSLPTQVRRDACKIGISGALTQKHPDGSIWPVAYASCSLSPVEQSYIQTEREASSGVWACEKFHFYIHGSQFELVGDHKPLKVLLNAVGTHHHHRTLAITASKLQPTHCLPNWHRKCC